MDGDDPQPLSTKDQPTECESENVPQHTEALSERSSSVPEPDDGSASSMTLPSPFVSKEDEESNQQLRDQEDQEDQQQSDLTRSSALPLNTQNNAEPLPPSSFQLNPDDERRKQRQALLQERMLKLVSSTHLPHTDITRSGRYKLHPPAKPQVQPQPQQQQQPQPHTQPTEQGGSTVVDLSSSRGGGATSSLSTEEKGNGHADESGIKESNQGDSQEGEQNDNQNDNPSGSGDASGTPIQRALLLQQQYSQQQLELEKRKQQLDFEQKELNRLSSSLRSTLELSLSHAKPPPLSPTQRHEKDVVSNPDSTNNSTTTSNNNNHSSSNAFQPSRSSLSASPFSIDNANTATADERASLRPPPRPTVRSNSAPRERPPTQVQDHSDEIPALTATSISLHDQRIRASLDDSYLSYNSSPFIMYPDPMRNSRPSRMAPTQLFDDQNYPQQQPGLPPPPPTPNDTHRRSKRRLGRGSPRRQRTSRRKLQLQQQNRQRSKPRNKTADTPAIPQTVEIPVPSPVQEPSPHDSRVSRTSRSTSITPFDDEEAVPVIHTPTKTKPQDIDIEEQDYAMDNVMENANALSSTSERPQRGGIPRRRTKESKRQWWCRMSLFMAVPLATLLIGVVLTVIFVWMDLRVRRPVVTGTDSSSFSPTSPGIVVVYRTMSPTLAPDFRIAAATLPPTFSPSVSSPTSSLSPSTSASPTQQ